MNPGIKKSFQHLAIGLLKASLFTALAVVASGCVAQQPKGMEKPRTLSETEKSKVIEIALSTPEVQQWQEKESNYRTALSWVAIVWRDSEASEIRYLPFDHPEADPNYQLVLKESVWYPAVVIHFGEPSHWVVQVAVDVETRKAVNVISSPDLSSPERFRTPPTPKN